MNEQPREGSSSGEGGISESPFAEVEAPASSEMDLGSGQTRMEVAFGAGDGDEDASAVVAQRASLGILFEQIYRPWDGELGPRWVRNYAIFRHHVYGLFTSKGHRYYHPFVRLTIVVIMLASLTPIAMIFLSSTIAGSGAGSDWLTRMWGVNRYNLWGQVLGYFPRNLCMWPVLTALVVGGMISDDRKNGTSAIYFSRPVTRIDYTAMKYLSAAVVLGFVIVFSYVLYYTTSIVFRGEGWAFLIDTLPIFLGGLIAGILLVITYTSIGMALSSLSQSRFFAAVAFLAIIFGTKLVALLVDVQFDTSILYIFSPYDSLAHVGQWLVGIPLNYSHPLAFSIVSILVFNAVSIGILVNRVSSLEVTRE
ncbi:MAG: ABC transporter permease [Candidatus Poseidoniia archaeon]